MSVADSICVVTPQLRVRKWPIGRYLLSLFSSSEGPPDALADPLSALIRLNHLKFPYGYSHRCILQLAAPLFASADEHTGKFPTGEYTPGASMSLLSRTQLLDAELLHGKTAPRCMVEAELAGGGLLAHDCGRHCVAGLRINSDPGIGISWYKVGFGHNGQKSDCHEVLFLTGAREFLAKMHWAEFLDEQAKLRAESALHRSDTMAE